MGGLEAARALGLKTGGTAPREWLTESGPQETLLHSFGLRECGSEGYPPRTRQNVIDSDGTLLVGPHQSGGSKLTYDIARKLKKPVFLLQFPENQSRVEEFRRWL